MNVASSPGVNLPANKVNGEKLATTEGASLVNLKIGEIRETQKILNRDFFPCWIVDFFNWPVS